MAYILILGAGSMGTAFSFPCSDNSHQVTIVGTYLENDFIDKINSTKKHPALDCEVPKNVRFLKFRNFAKEINEKVDLIVIAVIAKGIEWASIEISKVLVVHFLNRLTPHDHRLKRNLVLTKIIFLKVLILKIECFN